MIIQPLLFAATNACLDSINSFLSSPITGWFPVAFLGVLAIMFILSLLYAIAPFVGRTEIRTWARLKMFETMFAFFLVLIFASFATMLCTVNPVPTYISASLVPNACNPNVTSSASSVNNIFALAECDLYNYNSNIINMMNNMIAGITVLVGAAPSTQINGALGTGAVLKGFKFSFGISLDASSVKLFFESAAGAFGGLILISQLQLVLLDAAMVIFAILLPLGLLARIFGVTRSFGGAMIAFAMGLGFVFPLIISITYGFLGSMIDAFLTLSAPGSAFNFDMAQVMISATQSGGASAAINFLPATIGTLFSFPLNFFFSLLEYLGIGIVGTLFMPILTFTIVNTFIIDFSQAIGERMDFMSLLTSVI